MRPGPGCVRDRIRKVIIMRYETFYLPVRLDRNQHAIEVVDGGATRSLNEWIKKNGGRVISAQLVGEMTPNAQAGYPEGALLLVLEHASV